MKEYSIYGGWFLEFMHKLAKLRNFCMGNSFQVNTNLHKLQPLLEQKELQGRQRKQDRIILECGFDIEHVKEESSKVTGALSKRPTTPSLLSIDPYWES